MFKVKSSLFLSVILSIAAYGTQAEDMHGMGNMQTDAGVMSTQVHHGHGVVNKINVEAGKVNISHEPIGSMNWPKMTMDFSVQNKAELGAIQPGMTVDFEMTKVGKSYPITRIVPAK
jgi:Cu/Ag efflux protein CusF